MNESEDTAAQTAENGVEAENVNPQPDAAEAAAKNVVQAKNERLEARRWWTKLLIQPALLLACGAALIAGLGVAQRLDFISAGGGGESHASAGGGQSTRYICPMMCTPPQSEPGRCPVCAMELVPSTAGGGNSDTRSVQIDPASRRVANIQTVAVTSTPMKRTIRAIGELCYDEGTMKTLSAYVDGRLDRLYADYTGIVVKKNDDLALVYSPRLYSGQIEFLLAKKAHENSRTATLARVIRSSTNLYESARERLRELGMTSQQIAHLETDGQATSRLHLSAPISGTVIEKLAVEGQYVKEGQAIYKLADLSTVWLMLELFPEDAATIRYGQKVEAVVQSLPGRKFTGRVAFIDPNVNEKTRTVGVRVVIENKTGLLRIGDYAKATIDVPLNGTADQQGGIYDPELANKWISPRHPHVIESSAGKCRVCNVDLRPAADFGFVSKPGANGEALVVPRDAVLMAGDNSVLYVETEPGRFEIRNVELGACCGKQIVILNGVEEGERVATRGNFLIDSQMQLAGNPSLIDPTKILPKLEEAPSAELIAVLEKLSEEDRGLVENQRICPVTMMALGSMGSPQKVDVNGKPVFICCEGCRASLLEEPQVYLAKLDAAKTAPSEESLDIPLPPMGDFQVIEPASELPRIEAPMEIVAPDSEVRQTPNQGTGPVVALPMEVVR